jgi:hypothetical protein
MEEFIKTLEPQALVQATYLHYHDVNESKKTPGRGPSLRLDAINVPSDEHDSMMVDKCDRREYLGVPYTKLLKIRPKFKKTTPAAKHRTVEEMS